MAMIGSASQRRAGAGAGAELLGGPNYAHSRISCYVTSCYRISYRILLHHTILYCNYCIMFYDALIFLKLPYRH